VLSRPLPSAAGLPFRRAAFTAAAMIFIAAACVVATTTVVVGVAVATRVHELLAPAKQSCFPADAETKEPVEQRDDSAGCTAHLLHLYQQA
jgi:hypothetical protein